jgi:hypothetical protein
LVRKQGKQGKHGESDKKKEHHKNLKREKPYAETQVKSVGVRLVPQVSARVAATGRPSTLCTCGGPPPALRASSARWAVQHAHWSFTSGGRQKRSKREKWNGRDTGEIHGQLRRRCQERLTPSSAHTYFFCCSCRCTLRFVFLSPSPSLLPLQGGMLQQLRQRRRVHSARSGDVPSVPQARQNYPEQKKKLEFPVNREYKSKKAKKKSGHTSILHRSCACEDPFDPLVYESSAVVLLFSSVWKHRREVTHTHTHKEKE